MQYFEFKRKYGVALAGAGTSPVFTLQSPASVDSDTFKVSASFAAGDVKVSKDGAAFANVAVVPATLGNGYLLKLSSAEMQASEIDVIVKDAAGGPTFRDAHIKVITELQLGNVDIDAATGQKANTTALKCTGYGTEHGIEAIGGATGNDIDGVIAEMVIRKNTAQAGAAGTITLDSSASATNDVYNGNLIFIIGGTGIGQSRLITDYVGSTKVATIDTGWAVNPGATSVFVIAPGPRTWYQGPGTELSAIPTFASSYGALLQGLFQRFFYEYSQTTSVATMVKVDDITALDTGTVADDATTQTKGRMGA